MAAIGLVVPPTAIPEAALIDVAKKHYLLGASAEPSEIEVHRAYLGWGSRWTYIYIYIYISVYRLHGILYGCMCSIWTSRRQPLSPQWAVQAWASREGDLHRGLMQYAIRRSNRNPSSRTESSSMMDHVKGKRDLTNCTLKRLMDYPLSQYGTISKWGPPKRSKKEWKPFFRSRN